MKYKQRGNKWTTQLKYQGKVQYFSFDSEQEVKDFILLKEMELQSKPTPESNVELSKLIDQFVFMKYSNKSKYTLSAVRPARFPSYRKPH